MGRRRPSVWEQLLFWPHQPPDPVKHAAAATLRHGTLPPDRARARAALPVARRSQALLALVVLALLAATCVALAEAAGAHDGNSVAAASLVAAMAGWAAAHLGRLWRRQARRVARLARYAAVPTPRGPVVVTSSAPVAARRA